MDLEQEIGPVYISEYRLFNSWYLSNLTESSIFSFIKNAAAHSGWQKEPYTCSESSISYLGITIWVPE
jgi:hypothetical protein